MLVTLVFPAILAYLVARFISVKLPMWWGKIIAIIVSVIVGSMGAFVVSGLVAEFMELPAGAAMMAGLGRGFWVSIVASSFAVFGKKSAPAQS